MTRIATNETPRGPETIQKPISKFVQKPIGKFVQIR